MQLEFCVKKGMCMGDSWLRKKDNRKVTFNGGCSVLMKGSQRKFVKDVRAIGGKLQHKLLKVVLDERWIRKSQQSLAVKLNLPNTTM